MFKIKRAIFNKYKRYEIKKHPLNYLFWECTTRCNLNCLHCGSDCSKNSSSADMPLEDFLKALETISYKPEHFTVVLTGGEPLLRKDITTCGREIRKKGFRWSMVSNALLYDEPTHIQLLNAGMGALTFSLDGLNDNHNWLRNNSQSFEKVSTALDLVANTNRLNFDVVTCVNRKNINELESIYHFLISKKVKAWRLFTIAPIGRAGNNPDLFLSDMETKRLFDFICDKRKEKKIDIKFSCEGYTGKYELKVRDSFFFCRAGINIGSILIDGSISACPNIDRDFVQGNIYQDNFYEIWKTKYQDFRNRDWTKTGICTNCREYKYCQGNGLHYWQKDNENVLICHHQKIKGLQ